MEQTQGDDPNQTFYSEYNTRLRDIEERSRIVKERTHLLGRNLIDLKQENSEDIKELKIKVTRIEREIEKLKSIANSLIRETDKYAKKEEMIILERMLKDFQPLDFVRMKDLDKILDEKFTKHKKI